MANIKELKKKIKSTKGTLKITMAMKLVSGAKLNRAQHAITSSRPYANELEDLIKTVSALVQNYRHDYLEENEENKRSALLVVSSDKGLCGSYNSGLIKKVKAFINEIDEDFKVYFIGKKAKDILGKDVNTGKYFTFEKNEASFLEIQKVGQELGNLFKTGEFGKVYVAYNIFHSAISFESTVKKILPMTVNLDEKIKLKEKFPFDFKYEPNPKTILDHLIPETFISTLWTCVLDARAAEHGSRMTAMDSASGNCKEAIRTLTLKMNKLRQAAITTELIEVVSGAESLNG
ncbi:MAG: ATP synthase F1 subunit gamma [Halobacteriovoraceae bacterium]|nr:ATP synthase F1 subunit gamma [Halobacteriovoraceae bacterium]